MIFFDDESFINIHGKIILLKTVIYIKTVLFYLMRNLKCFFQINILLNVTENTYDQKISRERFMKSKNYQENHPSYRKKLSQPLQNLTYYIKKL